MIILAVMFVAGILYTFHLDKNIIGAVNEVFHTDYSTDVYWLLFLFLGIMLYILDKLR